MRLEAHFKCEHDQYAAHPLNPDLPVLADGVNLCRGGVSRPVSIDYEVAIVRLRELNRQAVAGFASDQVGWVANQIVDAALVGFLPQPEGAER